jgi:hypothetical protein
MEINTSNLNNTLNIETAKIVEPSTTSTVATENSRTPTPPSTDTVSFSAAAIALSSTDNESTEIGNVPCVNLNAANRFYGINKNSIETGHKSLS